MGTVLTPGLLEGWHELSHVKRVAGCLAWNEYPQLLATIIVQNLTLS